MLDVLLGLIVFAVIFSQKIQIKLLVQCSAVCISSRMSPKRTGCKTCECNTITVFTAFQCMLMPVCTPTVTHINSPHPFQGSLLLFLQKRSHKSWTSWYCWEWQLLASEEEQCERRENADIRSHVASPMWARIRQSEWLRCSCCRLASQTICGGAGKNK